MSDDTRPADPKPTQPGQQPAKPVQELSEEDLGRVVGGANASAAPPKPWGPVG